MALCPFAEHKLLPENDTQDAIAPRMVILHSAGGEAELFGWWQNDQSRGLESHFWVGRDGRTVQYVDTEVQADANGQANGYAVSIETASTTHATEPWDPAQLAAIIRLTDWLCTTHGIPRTLADRPTGAGIAWHVQFGAPGPWTSAAGKVCPGPARIRQVTDRVIPALAARPSPPDQEDIMATLDDLAELLDSKLAGIRSNTLAELGQAGTVLIRDDRKSGSQVWATNGLERRPVADRDEAKVLERILGLPKSYPDYPVVAWAHVQRLRPVVAG